MRISIWNFAPKKEMRRDFINREMECEHNFRDKGQFWHLCTPGNCQEIIFKTDDDYRFGITSSAMSLHEINSEGGSLKIYAFALMSNHVHNLLCGPQEECNEYFRRWKGRLMRYFEGRIDFSKFKCQLIAIEDLKDFRYEVAYINRNGFVNNLKEIPFSYEWSSGRYYFNPVTKEIPVTGVKDMSCREKKALFKSRLSDLYDSLSIGNGYVSPLCFCEISDGEKMYNTPHQYFNYLYKSVEEYNLIAKKIGDSIFLNDNEMLSVVYSKSRELYNVEEPKLLNAEDKIKMARMIHNEYRASNSQIQRILKLDQHVIDTLFPKAR